MPSSSSGVRSWFEVFFSTGNTAIADATHFPVICAIVAMVVQCKGNQLQYSGLSSLPGATVEQ